LILQECLFDQTKFEMRNQTHEEPDRELRLTGLITLQNRKSRAWFSLQNPTFGEVPPYRNVGLIRRLVDNALRVH
jgi:hypothetical protein